MRPCPAILAAFAAFAAAAPSDGAAPAAATAAQSAPGITPEQESALRAIDGRIDALAELGARVEDTAYRTATVAAVEDFRRRRRALAREYDAGLYEALMHAVISRYQVVSLWLTPARELPPADGPDTRTVPGLGLALVRVRRGSFDLGHPEGYPGSSPDERPVTRVTFTRDFWLGVTEVSVAQWRRFAEATGYVTEAELGNAGILFRKGEERRPGHSWRDPGFPQTERHPVVGVSWRDARQFCLWLTEREGAAGRLPGGYVYTLPTEAQWEYACRAGANDDPTDAGDFAWYAGNSGGVPHPVGTKRANPWGLHDLQGNVWEWVHDWYGRYPGGSVADPAGPASPNDPAVIRPLRQARGGGARDPGGHGIMSTNRWSTWGVTAGNWIGFRVALSAPPGS